MTCFLNSLFKLKFTPSPPSNPQSRFRSMGDLLLIVRALVQVCGRLTACLPQGTLWQYQMCNLGFFQCFTHTLKVLLILVQQVLMQYS